MLGRTLTIQCFCHAKDNIQLTKPEVDTKVIQQQYSYKWSLYRVIRGKLLFDGKGVTFLLAEQVNLLRGIFLVAEMSKYLAVG